MFYRIRTVNFNVFTFILFLSFCHKILGQTTYKADLLESSSQKDRVYDFSFSGYKMGAKLPRVGKTMKRVNIREFGAIPNDGKDDSAAIKKAILSTAGKNQYIFLPNGVYDIKDQIIINGVGNWTLIGKSMKKVIFKVSKPLCALPKYNSCNRAEKSLFAYDGGYLEIYGKDYITSQNFVSGVSADSSKGLHRLKLTNLNGLKAGDAVTLLLSDSNNTLVEHILGRPKVDDTYRGKSNLVRFTSKISRIDAPNKTIFLERQLPFNVKTSWSPRVYRYRPPVKDIIIQNITLSFPVSTYKSHAWEDGYNGIFIEDVSDVLIRNFKIVNTDYAFNIQDAQFVSLLNTQIVNKQRGHKSDNGTMVSGHHGWNLKGTRDSLVHNFKLDTSFIHDLSVESNSRGNVFSKGKGRNINLDHHGNLPKQNLYSNIDLGLGTRVYASGGASTRMPNTGGWNVYWNLRAKTESLGMSCYMRGGMLSFVGVPGYNRSCGLNWYNEEIPEGNKISPYDLYISILKQRNPKLRNLKMK